MDLRCAVPDVDPSDVVPQPPVELQAGEFVLEVPLRQDGRRVFTPGGEGSVVLIRKACGTLEGPIVEGDGVESDEGSDAAVSDVGAHKAGRGVEGACHVLDLGGRVCDGVTADWPSWQRQTHTRGNINILVGLFVARVECCAPPTIQPAHSTGICLFVTERACQG